MMTLEEIKNLGRLLTAFLAMFADCFLSLPARRLFRVYVKGQLSDVKRKNCEAIALKFNQAPRTLQRFLESIKWDEEKLRDRCQQILARDHAHEEAIGTVDESGISKSGSETAGAARQYNGHRGKVDNCTVGVHLAYSTPGFHTLLDSQLYLPEDWAHDKARRKKNQIPDEIVFQTKPQIALGLIDRALKNGVRVAAWTFDELYGRDSKFLDGLEDREQAYVAEIPCDTHVWTTKPQRSRKKPRKAKTKQRKTKQRKTKQRKTKQRKTKQRKKTPRDCEVRNLLKFSSRFQKLTWQRYRIKDTQKGPEVWEVKWLKVWRKTEDKLPSRQQTLIVARNVRTGELKFFLSNQVVGRSGVTLRWLLRVAFRRWTIEACFRVAKDELGMDHFQVRGWRSIHRHYYVTALSSLLCSRIRQSLDKHQTGDLTVEQVRRSLNCYLMHHPLPAPFRDEAYEKELESQRHYQERTAQSKTSHTKTRIQFYHSLGIDVDKIKSCVT